MTRSLAAALLLACYSALLGCGKYGPPVRSHEREQPAADDGRKEEATP